MKFFIVLLIAILSHTAFADEIVSTRTVILPVELSTTNVKLSAAGYMAPLVKVLVPALAGPTIMNHRNEGELAPCLATYEIQDPNIIIDVDAKTLQVPMVITLTKKSWITGNICNVYLREDIKTEIRGYRFVHSREQSMPDRDPTDCEN